MYVVLTEFSDRYVVKRWCKGIKDGQLTALKKNGGNERLICSSVWKMQMTRKMNLVIAANQHNKNVRANSEKYFSELKELVELDVGSICWEGDDNAGKENCLKGVLNPPRSRQKGVWNKRFKSIVEKKSNEIKRRKSKKLPRNDVCLPKGSHEVWVFSFLLLWMHMIET